MLDFSWITDFYNWVSELISADGEYLLRTYGYYIIVLLTFLEGETIVIIAGMLAAKGLLDPYYVTLCAFVGSCSGDQLMFSLGKYKGQNILTYFPKFRHRIKKAEKLFKKYDTVLILGFRFVYGVRNITPIMLGLSGVSHKKFLGLNVLGAGVWAIAFTAGGLYFGKLFEKNITTIGLTMLGFVAFIALCIYVHNTYKRKKIGAIAKRTPPEYISLKDLHGVEHETVKDPDIAIHQINKMPTHEAHATRTHEVKNIPDNDATNTTGTANNDKL